MIRVGFVLEGYSWLGGVNYYRNLLSALNLITDRKVCPIMFIGTQVPDNVVSNFYCVEIVKSKILDSHTLLGLLRRTVRKFSDQHDRLFTKFLEDHNIDVLSHFSGTLSRRTRIKTIGWIPDFQHLHLLELFDEKDRALRNAACNRITRNCHRILLSSETAKRDLAQFSPEALNKTRVLRFVPEVDISAPVISVRDLEKKYGFHGPYFYLPNQFWLHKNHKIVIEALAALKQAGINATVLATGNTYDHRYPNHFSNLMALAKCYGLTDSFKVLGVIPYNDLLSLMHHSLAVINPSLFEGWSTTVEEAKALNKTILLSNLDVHKEQNPDKGIYFDPTDAKELGKKMLAVMENGADQSESGDNLTYSNNYKNGRLNFALGYQDIVVQLFDDIN